jgi:competence protein ComEC
MPWLACLALAASAIGLGVGALRLAAIDAGALELEPGREVVVRGHVAAVPRRADGEVVVAVETAAGRVLVVAREPVADLPVGAAVQATGVAREPGDWERARLHRLGIHSILEADRMTTRSRPERDGLTGMLDRIRSRAEAALGRGTNAPAADLLRGFVLGQDDRIDAETVDRFKASGLAHLLAVSGQNVVLLAVLATVVLAVLGVGLRWRLLWVLALIAVYVPVAGAGPSIQRAGVMGAAGIVAALAGRPRSRWYALGFAACATLALDPRASADVGWQLSFAAVAGILLFSAPTATLLAGGAGGWRRALADGVALTVAATLATAPLMAHHFGAVSVVALPANLLALPAVAPVMWLGMAAGAAGQIAWLPVEPLTWLAGVLAGFIAQVAEWFAAPAWAQTEVGVESLPAVGLAYATLTTLAMLGLRAAARRRRLRIGRASTRGGRPRLAAALGLGAGAFAVAVLVADSRPNAPPQGLRVTVLDVGQGDAILLEPAGAAPVLVDAGPESADVAAQLAERGVDRLAVLAITHPESDHDGGAGGVLTRLTVDRLAFARAAGETRAAARAAGVRSLRLAAGDRVRLGALQLEVLWPPAERLAAARGRPIDDPNALALVVLARWRGFEILLTGDAEAELAPVDAGPVDVLKLAHHGSADGGLEALLQRAAPDLALISVGEANPFGHPAPETLAALDAAGVPFLRTDTAGEIVLESAGGRWWVAG